MLKPHEKAKSLVENYKVSICKNGNPHHLEKHAKECALTCVDKIIEVLMGDDIFNAGNIEYWNEVKEEIEKM